MSIAGKNLLLGFPVVKNVHHRQRKFDHESLKIIRDNSDAKKKKILKQNVRSTSKSRNHAHK